MKLPIIFFCVLFHIGIAAKAQSNMQAWYKKGQVWIIWENNPPSPATYEIYQSPVSVTSIHQAHLIGKLTSWEWTAGAIKDQLNRPTFNWKVPHPNQNRQYQIDTLHGLFVYTPHSADTTFFAVVKQGDTLITAGVNQTAAAVPFAYDPVNDPVTCHKQSGKVLPGGYKSTIWAMWADGREEHWNGRPDFPVMANQYKNGQPSIFIVSEAIGMDTTEGKKIPATLWLHGGKGNAIQSLPDRRPEVNIEPQEGILVAHNDDFIHFLPDSNTYVDQISNTWFFGWAKSKDPYDTLDNAVVEHDTIINYTQRRIDWINDWLIENYQVDPERIHINGHSMGSAGTTALMKAYPNRYASVTIFNNGLDGHSNTSQGFNLFGDTTWNNPTNLYRQDGSNVHIRQAFNLNDRSSPARDLPLVRMFHAKNDDNGVMMWDAYVVSEYKKADSLGWGMQLYWSERRHGIDTGDDDPLHPDHWTHGASATEQTVRDNVAYEETKYWNTSFPAFYNHRIDPQAHDPGDGALGILANGGNGDDWGTWGGYHDWNQQTLVDAPCFWQVSAWLMDSAEYVNDNCPNDSLVASLSIRKPQQFLPEAGTTIYWTQVDETTQAILHDGIVTTGPDGLVSADSIVLYRYPRKTTITFSQVRLAAMLSAYRAFANPSDHSQK